MPKPDFTYFTIFGAMRTGSNLLERSLDSYEGLTGLGELFNSIFVGKPKGETYLGITLAERNRDPLGYLSDVIAETPGIPGFRIFPGHDARIIDHAARDPACAKIILSRSPVDSFISLKIATETGQWMLAKEENRRLVKVHFDVAEFEDYRDELAAHYAVIRRKMSLAGQAPLEVAYDDLRDVEVLNGIAAFIGSADRLAAAPQKIQRQNPPSWEDKVVNVEEMQAYLGASGGTVQAPRPETTPRFEPLDALVASRGFSLIYAPVPGAGEGAIRRFIRAAELAAGVAAKPLATGLKEAHITRRRRRGGFMFTFIRHPALRVEDVFRRRIATTGEGAFADVQTLLAETYGAPLPEDMERDPAARVAGLSAFITFIADNLAGRTPMRQYPAWMPQHILLAAYAAEAPVDFTGRCERAAEDAAYVLSRLNVADRDGGLARGLADAVNLPDAGTLLTPAHERQLLEIYARDYARLGYSLLTE